jgi:hypothetical protein
MVLRELQRLLIPFNLINDTEIRHLSWADIEISLMMLSPNRPSQLMWLTITIDLGSRGHLMRHFIDIASVAS